MHMGRHIVQELVIEFGTPIIEPWDVPLTEPEFREIKKHLTQGRAHDVTLLILKDEQIAVVRRPGDPPDAFRIPSGGIHPEESFVDGAAREALEETGLAVHVRDYLLQIHADFTLDGEKTSWTTHVMLATAEDGAIGPKDREAFEVARWVAMDDLVANMNPLLEASSLGDLRYRARIHQRLAELLEQRDHEKGDR